MAWPFLFFQQPAHQLLTPVHSLEHVSQNNTYQTDYELVSVVVVSGPDVTKKALIQMGSGAPGTSLTASNLLYNPALRNTPSPIPPPRATKSQSPPKPIAPTYQQSKYISYIIQENGKQSF